MMRWGAVLLSLLVAMAILAGCGGGGGTEASGASTAAAGEETAGGEEAEGPAVNEEAAAGAEEGEGEGGEETGKEGEEEEVSPEKAAFIKKGDKICEGIPASYNKKVQALEKQAGKRPPTKVINEKAAVPPLYVAIEEFEALTAPQGEEAELEAVISSLEAAAKGLEEKPESELSGPKSPFAEFQKVTGDYGFKYCPQL